MQGRRSYSVPCVGPRKGTWGDTAGRLSLVCKARGESLNCSIWDLGSACGHPLVIRHGGKEASLETDKPGAPSLWMGRERRREIGEATGKRQCSVLRSLYALLADATSQQVRRCFFKSHNWATTACEKSDLAGVETKKLMCALRQRPHTRNRVDSHLHLVDGRGDGLGLAACFGTIFF